MVGVFLLCGKKKTLPTFGHSKPTSSQKGTLSSLFQTANTGTLGIAPFTWANRDMFTRDSTNFQVTVPPSLILLFFSAGILKKNSIRLWPKKNVRVLDTFDRVHHTTSFAIANRKKLFSFPSIGYSLKPIQTGATRLKHTPWINNVQKEIERKRDQSILIKLV